MKLRKKSLWIVLLVAVVALCVAVLPNEAEAASTGPYTYEVSGGSATITKYDTNADTSTSKTLRIPETLGGVPVTKIGPDAFSFVNDIETFIIPDTVTHIGNGAFRNCTNMQKLELPENLEYIDDYAFSFCRYITTLEIGDKVEYIGKQAFRYCEQLETVILPDNLQTVGEDAFIECAKLTKAVYCGSNWNAVSVGTGNDLLTNAYQAHEFNNPVSGPADTCYYCGYVDGLSFNINYSAGTASVYRYSGTNKNLTIPATYNGYPVTAILSYAFEQNTTLERISFSGPVTTIGDGAFGGCANLQEIVLPATLTKLGENVFVGCEKLETVQIPASLTEIGKGAFSNSSLTSIAVPATVKTIGESAFEGCNKLTSVTLTAGLETIGNRAFHSCMRLQSITIPEGVTSVGNQAFMFCASLEKVVLPNSLTKINSQLFENCQYLDDITFPNNLTEIGNHALDGTAFTKLVIPATVKILGDGVLSECPDLTQVVLPAGITHIGAYQFVQCPSLQNVFYCGNNWSGVTVGQNNTVLLNALTFHDYDSNGVCRLCGARIWEYIDDGNGGVIITGYNGNDKNLTIPATLENKPVTKIGPNVFQNMTFLEKVTIPAGVTAIDNYAFSGCTALQEIVVPGNVKTIGNNAFTGCGSLEKIALKTALTSIGNQAFVGCGALEKVIYCGTVEQWNAVSVGTDNTLLTNKVQMHDYVSGSCTICGDTLPIYTVRFENWNGDLIVSQRYFAGDAIVPPANPTRPDDATYTYTFAGWNEEVAATCTGDVTYTATYTAERIGFTIVFQNWDGSVISSAYYALGDTVVIPADPTRPQDDVNTYAFAGWDKTVTTCQGEATYTATYTPTKRTYTVIFEDWDGAVLSTQTYHWGDTVVLPVNPTREGDRLTAYAFDGWGDVAALCAGNATYTATYTATRIGYEVTFKNPDGSILETKIYAPGETIVPPAGPTMAADNTYTYTFTGWDAEPSTSCDDDYTYTAQYDKEYIEYTVTFENWDGTVISENTYHWGDTITVPANPTRPDDRLGSYTFAGWNKEVSTTCKGDVVYAAKYEADYVACTIVFKDWNGDIISSEQYLYGDKIQIPAAPTREGNDMYSYSFAGWDREVVNCDGDATYTATYITTQRTYTITFKNWDGTVLSTDTYYWGQRLTLPDDPTRPDDNTNTYTFSGWDPAATACMGDATYTAQYTAEKKSFTVVFKNWDGSVLSSAVYYYGDNVTVPETPTRPDDSTHTYTFSGWDVAVTACMGDATYTAQYTATEKAPADKPCTDITLNVDTVVLEQAGAEVTITVTLSPADTDDVVSFRSENATIATVDANGKIVAVSAGTTKIIITCGDIVKECVVVCDLQPEPSNPTEPSEPSEPSEPTEPSKPDQGSSKPGKGTNDNHKRLIGVIIILLASLLALLVCIIFLRKNRDKENG